MNRMVLRGRTVKVSKNVLGSENEMDSSTDDDDERH